MLNLGAVEVQSAILELGTVSIDLVAALRGRGADVAVGKCGSRPMPGRRRSQLSGLRGRRGVRALAAQSVAHQVAHLSPGSCDEAAGGVFGDYVLPSRLREIGHLHRLRQPLDRVDALRQVIDDRYSLVIGA